MTNGGSLTNAKNLASFDNAKKISLSNPNITFCVSFPSDNKEDFDSIMRINIYEDVLKAIENLGKLRQNIELRIVITKKNHKRLKEISEFMYRNFPYVMHIAFMGMEVTGYAMENISEIEVDPGEYNSNLIEAVRFLKRRNMNVSVYNLPYCVVESRLWPYLRNSISSWKKTYANECNLCTKKENCPGLFITSVYHGYKLNPI